MDEYFTNWIYYNDGHPDGEGCGLGGFMLGDEGHGWGDSEYGNGQCQGESFGNDGYSYPLKEFIRKSRNN
jgi:hypothetical protein